MLGVRGGPWGSVGVRWKACRSFSGVGQWVIVQLTIGVLVEVYCIVIVTCKMGQC